jgi:hypothetical protein
MKTSHLILIVVFFTLSGCEKKYDLDDVSNFELTYNTGSGWTGYLYNFRLNETGRLETKYRPPLSDSTKQAVYTIDAFDLMKLKPALVNFLNGSINENYGVNPGQITDLAGTGVSLKSNKKQITTSMYGASESELPESLKNLLGRISDLRSKYDTIVKF